MIPCRAWSREQSQRISGVDSISVSLYFEDQELCSFEEDCISDSQAGAMLNHTICMCLDPDSFRASCTARLSALHVLCLPLATLAYIADSACPLYSSWRHLDVTPRGGQSASSTVYTSLHLSLASMCKPLPWMSEEG